jgi:hypothetical protein
MPASQSKPSYPFIGLWDAIDRLLDSIETEPSENRPPSKGAKIGDTRWATVIRILNAEASLKKITIYGTPKGSGQHEAIPANIFISGGIDPFKGRGEGQVNTGPMSVGAPDYKQWRNIRFRFDEIECLSTELQSRKKEVPLVENPTSRRSIYEGWADTMAELIRNGKAPNHPVSSVPVSWRNWARAMTSRKSRYSTSKKSSGAWY